MDSDLFILSALLFGIGGFLAGVAWGQSKQQQEASKPLLPRMTYEEAHRRWLVNERVTRFGLDDPWRKN